MVMFRIGLVVVFLCVNAEAQTHCAGNWVSHGNSCYAFITTIKSSWIDAGAFCRNANAKLVEIESADEDNFLRAHLLASHTSGLDHRIPNAAAKLPHGLVLGRGTQQMDTIRA
uniref:Asialoglycoprotein receptor 1 n=1 Tax=Magallana gigas TaxID=29159 RepID=K1P4T6_MAGGI